jgi:hypothetical protein
VTPLDRYLGSGRVVRLADGGAPSVVVSLEDGTRVHATPAFTFPYEAAIADELLVIGDAAEFFLIGVLEGHGRTELSNARGVSIRTDGRLRVIGDRGVTLRGRVVDVIAERVSRVAVEARQTFERARSEVRDVLRVEATEIDERSERGFRLVAHRVILKALKGARLKSSTVRLG